MNLNSNILAIWLTDHIGTMYFFYLCCALALIPLIYPNSLSVVQFISSGFLQLVFLPLIVLTQNIQTARMEEEELRDINLNTIAEKKIEQLSHKLDRLTRQIKKAGI